MRAAKRLARDSILCGSPMSRTSTSPLRPSAPAWSTSWQASLMDMKKRSMRGSVTVRGSPRSNWEAKVWSTDPREPRTLPKRTEMKRRSGGRLRPTAAVSLSAMRLE